MDWFRWHHGSVNDPKWRVIARRSGVGIPTVIAIWAAMLETASQADNRGTIEGWVTEDIAAALDVDESDVAAVFDAMQGKVLDGEIVTGWDKRQPKREDTGAAERKRRQREKEREEEAKEEDESRNVTHGHAPSRDVTTDKIREEKKRKENTPLNPPKGDVSTSAGFACFWETYPRKRAKGQAEKAWKRIKPNEQLLQTILESVERAKTSDDWQKDGGQYIPYPGTWLNAKGWEDEYATNDVSRGDWWETAAGVLQRAQELGVEQRDGEPVGLLKERVRREEERCGTPA